MRSSHLGKSEKSVGVCVLVSIESGSGFIETRILAEESLDEIDVQVLSLLNKELGSLQSKVRNTIRHSTQYSAGSPC